MEYLFLMIALILLTVKGYCGKKTGNIMKDAGDAFVFNLVRMILCTIIGLVVVFAEGAVSHLKIDGGMVAICFMAGAANAAFLVGWLLAIQKNAMVTVDVTLTIGSMIPAILCLFLFREQLYWQKMVGFALIVIATFILAGYNKSTKGNVGVSGVVFLVMAAVGDGMVSFCQQLYKQYYTESGSLSGDVIYPKSIYHFYTYVFAGVILLGAWFIYEVAQSRKNMGEDKITVAKRLGMLKQPLPYLIVIAICLFAATYCQTIATNDYGMSSQVLYPVTKGGCLITVNITAMLFFGEKPTWRSVVGSFVTLVGIVVMNIL